MFKAWIYIRYYKVLYTLPYFSKELIFPPLSSAAPLIRRVEINLINLIEKCKVDWLRKLFYFLKNKFYDNRYSSDIIYIYYVDIDYLKKISNLFKIKNFVYGRVPTFFFLLSDDFERIFVTRR